MRKTLRRQSQHRHKSPLLLWGHVYVTALSIKQTWMPAVATDRTYMTTKRCSCFSGLALPGLKLTSAGTKSGSKTKPFQTNAAVKWNRCVFNIRCATFLSSDTHKETTQGAPNPFFPVVFNLLLLIYIQVWWKHFRILLSRMQGNNAPNTRFLFKRHKVNT